jgi:hypothetical protein
VNGDDAPVPTPVSGGTVDTPTGAGPGQEDSGGNGRDPNTGGTGGGGGRDRDGGGGAAGLSGLDNSPPDEQTLRFPQGIGRFSNFPDLDDKHVEINMRQVSPGAGAGAQSYVPVGRGMGSPGAALVDQFQPGSQTLPGYPYGRNAGGPVPIKRGIPGSAAPARSTFEFLPWQQAGDGTRQEVKVEPAVVSPMARARVQTDGETVSPIRGQMGEKVKSPIVSPHPLLSVELTKDCTAGLGG